MLPSFKFCHNCCTPFALTFVNTLKITMNCETAWFQLQHFLCHFVETIHQQVSKLWVPACEVSSETIAKIVRIFFSIFLKKMNV